MNRMYRKENFQTLPRSLPKIPEDKILIFHDPDAVGMNQQTQTFVHWSSAGLPYIPPTPPPGTGIHHYTFAFVDRAPEKTGIIERDTMGSFTNVQVYPINSGEKGGSRICRNQSKKRKRRIQKKQKKTKNIKKFGFF